MPIVKIFVIYSPLFGAKVHCEAKSISQEKVSLALIFARGKDQSLHMVVFQIYEVVRLPSRDDHEWEDCWIEIG